MQEPLWPFLGSEVLAAKALPERVMRSLYEPVYPGVYAPSGIGLTASQRARAAWLWSRRRGGVAGNSARFVARRAVGCPVRPGRIGARQPPPAADAHGAYRHTAG